MKGLTVYTLLICGLLFSHFILVFFHFDNRIVADNIAIKITPLISFFGSSDQPSPLTSAIIGYLLFAIFLIAISKQAITAARSYYFWALTICFMSIAMELYVIASHSLHHNPTSWMRLGLVLFALCLKVFKKVYAIRPLQSKTEEGDVLLRT